MTRHLRLIRGSAPRLADVLDGYEVIGEPVVGPKGLTYVPWVDRAVAPYTATTLPQCTVAGLWDALRRASVSS